MRKNPGFERLAIIVSDDRPLASSVLSNISVTTPDAMSLFAAIESRASVRAFTAEPVTTEEINVLLRAAVRAPTAMHGEPWVFVVVQEPGQLKKRAEHAHRRRGNTNWSVHRRGLLACGCLNPSEP